MSQSPSLRGSGRFRTQTHHGFVFSSLNPLHCGAVVASPASTPRRREARVSIPFIAGQWSLRALPALDPDRGQRVSIPFIAGQWSLLRRCPRPPMRRRVSIPFIAGQWSLQVRGIAYASYLDESQSPSLRGSGRFRVSTKSTKKKEESLNPLHCGAVVASWARRKEMETIFVSQSPSLRGSGRFPTSPRNAATLSSASQSPSLRGSGRFLHAAHALPPPRGVSIPFIAGQWSLLAARRVGKEKGNGSQSPSLRGSGRFRQSAAPGARTPTSVSIPFIAGQWSLHAAHPRDHSGEPGLNPLHCGAVVASRSPPSSAASVMSCLNPLHCGAVVASRGTRAEGRREARLNPLHCGAVVASSCAWRRSSGRACVSIPFIAGQWSLQLAGEVARWFRHGVSIPFIAGQWSLR